MTPLRLVPSCNVRSSAQIPRGTHRMRRGAPKARVDMLRSVFAAWFRNADGVFNRAAAFCGERFDRLLEAPSI